MILRIKKTSSPNVMVLDVTEKFLTIEVLREYVIAQPECTQVTEIKDENQFSFEMGDEGVTYTLTEN